MPRQRSKERDAAFILFRDSGGKRALIDIAKELNVPDAQVRKWKHEDNWQNGSFTPSESVRHYKRIKIIFKRARKLVDRGPWKKKIEVECWLSLKIVLDTERELSLRIASLAFLDIVGKEWREHIPNKILGPLVTRNDAYVRDWRSKVLKRSGYKCQVCGSTNNLNAHHVRDWMRYPELRLDPDNGITLCDECHAKEHGLKFIAFKEEGGFYIAKKEKH